MSEVVKRTVLLLSLLLVVTVAVAVAGPYSDSAHGDKRYGVMRQVASISAPGPYATGNCAHCHEQHASIDGSEPQPQNNAPSVFSLFSPPFDSTRQQGPYQQADLFCFYCHSLSGSLQASAASMGNFDYSRNFGGLSSGGPLSIMAAFNQVSTSPEGSNHNLYDVWKFAQKFPDFSSSSAPCDACHNPHRARRNRANVTDPTFTAISLPNDHESLWGDQPVETMANYNNRYQPPLYAGGGGYEPGGVAAAFADGSQVPDYNSYCLTCHNEPIYSTSLGRNTLRIDWATPGGDSASSGDKHGMNGYTQELMVRPPYDNYAQRSDDFLLSCLDCHEPHGSPNAFLLRRGVNGGQLSGTVSNQASSASLGYLCRQCHKDDYAASGGRINSWETAHHSGSERPYNQHMCMTCHGMGGGMGGGGMPQIGCLYCHGHGSYADSTHPGTLPDGRRIPAPNGGVRRTF